MRSDNLNDEWWAGEYAEDIHCYLLSREKRCIPYAMQSPQLYYRRCLIEFLSDICKSLHFCTSVRHLAAYILDLFMDNYHVTVQHFQLVVVGCIIVAAKVDEKDMLIPRMSYFNAMLGNLYELNEFVNMEICIMEFFKWDLLMPTVATFVEYYSLHAISTSDSYTHLSVQNFTEAKKCITQVINNFLEMSLQEVSFRQFQASVVAASCVAYSRICLCLIPSWPRHLREVTHYDLMDLKDCLEMMIRCVEMEHKMLRKYSKEVSVDASTSYYNSDDGSSSSGCCSDCSNSLTDIECVSR